MEQRRRLVLFVVAAILAGSLYSKGHAPCRQHEDVAFSRCTSSGVTVRVKGTSAPGVYLFPAGFTVADVIKLTASSKTIIDTKSSFLSAPLRSGDVLDLTEDIPKRAISLTRMNAGEFMLLDIPLSPNQMDCADWQFLPGIGVKMAKKIVEDRQNFGVFRSIESLRRIPGMGEKKFNMIRKHFSY